jgi:hypothetical protein
VYTAEVRQGVSHEARLELVGLAVRPDGCRGRRDAKPSIAVLGLEVVEESDTPDAKAAQYAEALTDALRQRARLSSGPFTLAAGQRQEPGRDEAPVGLRRRGNACMADIGTELTADRLVYGHVQKAGGNYQITLKLLNVENKSIERTTSDLAPSAEASGSADITALGKKLYAKITGVSNQGTLIVKRQRRPRRGVARR